MFTVSFKQSTLQIYYQHFAFVADGGDCFCADQETLEGNGLVTDPTLAIGRCEGADQADQYCGRPGVAAAYATYHSKYCTRGIAGVDIENTVIQMAKICSCLSNM